MEMIAGNKVPSRPSWNINKLTCIVTLYSWEETENHSVNDF